MQPRIVRAGILERFHTVELVGEPKRLPSSFVRGVTKLPVQMHPQNRAFAGMRLPVIAQGAAGSGSACA